RDRAEQLPVTLKSVYEKRQRVEPRVSAELVRFTAARCGALIDGLGGGRQDWLPGYRVQVVDGNRLGASTASARAAPTRRPRCRGGAWPCSPRRGGCPSTWCLVRPAPPRSGPCSLSCCSGPRRTTSGSPTGPSAPPTSPGGRLPAGPRS